MSDREFDGDSDSPEEFISKQGMQQDEELRKVERENKARIVREEKERRRKWNQKLTPRSLPKKESTRDETEIETHEESQHNKEMLPDDIVKLLAAREKKVFASHSEDEQVEKKTGSRKRRLKKSGFVLRGFSAMGRALEIEGDSSGEIDMGDGLDDFSPEIDMGDKNEIGEEERNSKRKSEVVEAESPSPVKKTPVKESIQARVTRAQAAGKSASLSIPTFDNDSTELYSGYDSEYKVSSNYTEFYFEENKNLLSVFLKKVIRSEKVLDIAEAKKHGIFEFLESRNLLETVTSVVAYPELVITHVFTNLCPQFSDPRSSKYGKLFLRNQVFEFNAQVINETLGLDDVEEEPLVVDKDLFVKVLTGGKITTWPKVLSSSSLTSLYATLFKIAIYNWLPSSNETSVTTDHALLLYKLGENLKLNFGKLVFDQVSSVNKIRGGSILPFPSLIYKVLLKQGFKPKKSDGFSGKPLRFTVHRKIFNGDRVIDLPWKFGAQNTNVEEDVDNINTNISGSVSVSRTFLLDMIDKANQSIARAHQSIGEWQHVKDDCLAMLSSQKRE